MTTINIHEITTNGYFTKWPNTPRPLTDAHLRLAALIGVQPVTWDEEHGVYTVVYSSTRPGVDTVVTRATETRWLSTTVTRDNDPQLVWENEEDVLNTARWWLGAPDDPNWSLVVDLEYIDNLRSNPGTVDETLDV